jgi:ATP-dependent 26S proteasome regulatory subunit
VNPETLERENYGSTVLEAYDRICKDLRAETPLGRLNVIDGPPGTGKTWLTRGFLTDVRGVVFIIVQAQDVAHLADPEVLPALLRFSDTNGRQPLVLVIEDADEVLAPRDRGSMSTVSALLNLSDGLLGLVLDLRVIATTNAKRVELDPAVIRPGRLGTMAHVGLLGPEHCQAIYERLTGRTKVFWEEKTLAEVYSDARDTGWMAPLPGQPLGFGT